MGKGREEHLGTPPPGGLAHKPGMCPDWESTGDPLVCRPMLNPLSYVIKFMRLLVGAEFGKTMEQSAWEAITDPEEDLSKLDEKELAKRKSMMDKLFEKNQKDGSNSVNDVEIEFP